MTQHLGYATLTMPERTIEADTFTCAHCQRIVHIDKKKQNFGACLMCGHKFICLGCEALGKCTPFEKQLEQMERRDRFRRDAGLNG